MVSEKSLEIPVDVKRSFASKEQELVFYFALCYEADFLHRCLVRRFEEIALLCLADAH